MISRLAASRSAVELAWSRRSEIAWNSLRRVAISESVMSSGHRSSQGKPFLRVEELACVQYHDRPVGLAQNAGDVLGSQASDHRRRRCDGAGIDPDHLAHRIDYDADPLIFQLEHHHPGFLLLGRRYVEAFAEIHHGNNSLAVRQHTLQKRWRVG